MPRRCSRDSVNAEIGIVPGFLAEPARALLQHRRRIGSVNTGTQDPFSDLVLVVQRLQFLYPHSRPRWPACFHSANSVVRSSSKMASQSPAASTTPTAQPAQQQPTQPITATNDGKRKAETNGGTQTRAKRNRYISLAWYGSPCFLLGQSDFDRGS